MENQTLCKVTRQIGLILEINDINNDMDDINDYDIDELMIMTWMILMNMICIAATNAKCH